MWYIDTVRIYPNVMEDSSKQMVARLQPLASGTVHHIFGYEDPIFKLTCKVVGRDNLAALKLLRTLGTSVVLSGDGETWNVIVESVGASRDLAPFQTIDQSQDCTEPVYTVSLVVNEEI